MDLDTFRALLTPGGQALLAEAAALGPTEATLLPCITRLRRRHPALEPALVAAALEQVILRGKAAGKFARAERMYFTREGLEQATGEAVARHRARRYAPFGPVADLACGLGGDALALARDHAVVAVDRDPLRLALARENARVYGVAARLTPVLADLADLPPPRADALFCDPGRRVAGPGGSRRVFAAAGYQPPLTLVAGWRSAVLVLGIKV